MNARKYLVASMLAAGAAGLSPMAWSAVDVRVGVAPPPPRMEVVPAPRSGYVWAPGYWNWNGHRYVWHNGNWVRARHGHHWVAHNWEHQGDHWYYRQGHWDRD